MGSLLIKTFPNHKSLPESIDWYLYKEDLRLIIRYLEDLRYSFCEHFLIPKWCFKVTVHANYSYYLIFELTLKEEVRNCQKYCRRSNALHSDIFRRKKVICFPK